MIKEKAEQYFEKYPDLRVLFFDTAGEFATEVDGLNSTRFSVLKDAGTLTTKCGLMELVGRPRALYLPIEAGNSEEWLLSTSGG